MMLRYKLPARSRAWAPEATGQHGQHCCQLRHVLVPWLQDLQEFIMERAELRSAGILSAQDWGAIMAEGQRRLLQLKLPLLEVLRVLSDWVGAGRAMLHAWVNLGGGAA